MARVIADEMAAPLHEVLGQSVASPADLNGLLLTARRWLGWLAEEGHIATNPAKKVKELRRQALAPKGLDRGQVRRLPRVNR